MSEPVRVLFLCTHNASRSQMAEAFTRYFGKGGVEVFSAGSMPSERVHPLAVRAMADVAIDLSAAVPRSIEEFRGQPFDFVITVCERAKENCPSWPGVRERIHWAVSDPLVPGGTEEEQLKAFRRARDELRQRVNLFLLSNRIVASAPSSR